MKSRQEAFALLSEYTKNPSLIKHSLSVEAAMRWYAKHFGLSDSDTEKWGITGLLHDFDYEMYPNPVAPDGHPFKGNAILKELGYEQDICTAIMGHADYTGVPRTTQLDKALFACDEITGLITATTLVRPDKNINVLETKSVMKRMKEKSFAAGCNRDDIRLGAQELGLELDAHVTNVIQAMRGIASELGLAG